MSFGGQPVHCIASSKTNQCLGFSPSFVIRVMTTIIIMTGKKSIFIENILYIKHKAKGFLVMILF